MNTSFKKIGEKLLDVRIFIFLVPFSGMGDRGMGKWGVALVKVRIYWVRAELLTLLSLIFQLEHYRACEKIDFTENLDERDGQWKFLIPHKIYSELSLSRTGSELVLVVRIREVSAL